MSLIEIQERIRKEVPSQAILDALNELGTDLIMDHRFFNDWHLQESHQRCGDLMKEVFAKMNGFISEHIHKDKIKEFVASKQKLGYTIKLLSSRGESDYLEITMVKL